MKLHRVKNEGKRVGDSGDSEISNPLKSSSTHEPKSKSNLGLQEPAKEIDKICPEVGIELGWGDREALVS